jgi:hypothetical protein
MATKNGGVRPGAGRKPKAEKYSRDIVAAEKKIRDKLPDIVEAQIGLALGVVVKEFNPITQEDFFYTTIPDRAAGQYLINRIMGAPTQKVDSKVEILDPYSEEIKRLRKERESDAE